MDATMRIVAFSWDPKRAFSKRKIEMEGTQIAMFIGC
jgi:hypothetical protein